MELWQLDVVGGMPGPGRCAACSSTPCGSTGCELLADRVLTSLAAAQAALDDWVAEYNKARPHQGIGMLTSAERFTMRSEIGLGRSSPEPTIRTARAAIGLGP